MKGCGIIADGCGREPQDGYLGEGITQGGQREGVVRTGMTGFATRIVPRRVGR